MTLFAGADYFAPSVADDGLPRSGVARVPRFNLAGLQQPNVLLAIAALIVGAYLLNRWAKGGKR